MSFCFSIYIVYIKNRFQVVTLTSKAGYAGGEIGVYRSTADVEWLLRTLAVVCPHIVIPELKFDVSAITAQYHASTNSNAEAAMEAKRRVLEELFRRISLQELLCQQQCFTQFLVADDEAFRDAKAHKPISLIAQQIMERSIQNSDSSSSSSPRPVTPGSKKPPAPAKVVLQEDEYQYASNDDLEFETNPFGAVEDYDEEESVSASAPATERPRRRTILDEALPEEVEDYMADLTRFISVSGLEETQADGEAKEFYSYLGKAMTPTRALLNLCVTVLAGATQASQNLDKYVQALDGIAKTEVCGLPAALSVVS